MVTRIELQNNISRAKASIKSKQSQIRASRKKARFPGITISTQFSVGRTGVKPFRARRKRERKQSLNDLGIFSGEMVGLNTDFINTKQALFDFDKEVMI